MGRNRGRSYLTRKQQQRRQLVAAVRIPGGARHAAYGRTPIAVGSVAGPAVCELGGGAAGRGIVTEVGVVCGGLCERVWVEIDLGLSVWGAARRGVVTEVGVVCGCLCAVWGSCRPLC